MAPNSEILLTVQESEQFRAEKNRITYGERDADDAYQMQVYWPLARNPQCGVRSTRFGIWMFFFQPVPGHEYVVYYEFNDTLVVLLSIVPADQGFADLYKP